MKLIEVGKFTPPEPKILYCNKCHGVLTEQTKMSWFTDGYGLEHTSNHIPTGKLLCNTCGIIFKKVEQ